MHGAVVFQFQSFLQIRPRFRLPPQQRKGVAAIGKSLRVVGIGFDLLIKDFQLGSRVDLSSDRPCDLRNNRMHATGNKNRGTETKPDQAQIQHARKSIQIVRSGDVFPQRIQRVRFISPRNAQTCQGKGRKPKAEIRDPKEIRILKPELHVFGFRISFGFRLVGFWILLKNVQLFDPPHSLI